jgi:hypothetical protein
MGIIFKNIEDIEVIKSLFPKECKITQADDLDIYGDERQAGAAYCIYDDTFLLVPVKSKKTVQTLVGEREEDCIAWNVDVHWVEGGSYWEPPTTEEKELVTEVSFEDAIKAIHAEMLQCEINNTLEGLYYQSLEGEEEMEYYA